MLKRQNPRLKVVVQMIRRAEIFHFLCHLPIFQGMGDPSKNWVNPKEDTGNASSNVGMASGLAQISLSMPLVILTCHFGLSCTYPHALIVEFSGNPK